jgi:hypothetical protein
VSLAFLVSNSLDHILKASFCSSRLLHAEHVDVGANIYVFIGGKYMYSSKYVGIAIEVS